ncbi:MAG TPA: hypothetical protein VLF71_00490 [Candidatus Saccharimonadales bacterium]|nr:hypothetical protein [Candidatus Saccharimonadales bacterium]
MSELSLFTIPSYWRHPALPRFREPYPRVVGVETAVGLIACRFALPPGAIPELMTFDVPEPLAQGVAGFYDRHIARQDPEDPHSPDRAPYGRTGLMTIGRVRYNCHTFAEAMQPGSVPYDGRLHNLKQHIQDQGKAAEPFSGYLPAGAHGMVKNMETGYVSHSFIGLGEDVPLTLQAIDNNGNLGVLPYPTVLNEYGRHRSGAYMLVA